MHIDPEIVAEFIDNLELLIEGDEPLIMFQEEIDRFKKAIAEDEENN